jgi:hypothetical protein
MGYHMRRNKILLHMIAAVGLAQLLLTWGCFLNDGDDNKPNKTVLTYTLSKLDMAQAHNIAPDKIRGLVSSGDGEWVYVVGKSKASLRSLDVENKKWSDALGDFKGLLKAEDRQPVGDLSASKINGFSPSLDGILVMLSDNKGLVVLGGSGVANASHYTQGADKSFPFGASTPFLAAKGAEHFIYLFDAGVAKKGVRFRAYVEPPKLDAKHPGVWNDSLKKSRTPKADLDRVFLARTQDNQGNLLLADQEGIKRLLAADIGVDKKALDNEGKPIFTAKSFMLDGKTKNDHVNTMALVDNKFLVVGFKATEANNGGIAVADITKPDITFKKFGVGHGWSVDSIATERIKHPEKTRIAAVITTDLGLLFLDNDGQVLELVKGQGQLLTADFINKHRVESKDYDKAVSGFGGDNVVDPGKRGYLGAAQDKNGRWYLGFSGVNGGLFTLDIMAEQVEAPKPPPVLP